MTAEHKLTVKTFTRQAVSFAEAPQIRDEEALRLVCELTTSGADDTVPDVACGLAIAVIRDHEVGVLFRQQSSWLTSPDSRIVLALSARRISTDRLADDQSQNL